MEKEGPRTPAQRIEEALKAMLKDFSKTPYIYPVAIAIAAAVYYLVLVYATGICLIGLVTPLILLGFLWMFGVKGVKRLVIIGLVAVVVLSLVWLGVFTAHYLNVQPEICTSEDYRTLTNGICTPLHGPSGQVYNFTLEIHPNATAPVNKVFKNVTVAVSSVEFPGGLYENHTMLLDRSRSTNDTLVYYHDTTVKSAVNIFLFWAEYPNNTVEIGAVWSSVGVASFPEGPISTDTGAILLTLIPYAFIQTLLNMYVPFILIVGMIWWTRRARKMREQQIEKWKLEEAEKEAAQPRTAGLKVPSVAKAKGTSKGTGETFVCSECGADVPADATVCPNCGEKFD